jgi:hypothetical protein
MAVPLEATNGMALVASTAAFGHVGETKADQLLRTDWTRRAGRLTAMLSSDVTSRTTVATRPSLALTSSWRPSEAAGSRAPATTRTFCLAASWRTVSRPMPLRKRQDKEGGLVRHSKWGDVGARAGCKHAPGGAGHEPDGRAHSDCA